MFSTQVAASYREVVEALDSTKVLKEKIASFWTAMVKVWRLLN